MFFSREVLFWYKFEGVGSLVMKNAERPVEALRR